jgi:hypothetical protein
MLLRIIGIEYAVRAQAGFGGGSRDQLDDYVSGTI